MLIDRDRTRPLSPDFLRAAAAQADATVDIKARQRNDKLMRALFPSVY